MAVNTIRSQKEKEEKKNLFSFIDKGLKINKLFEEGIPTQYIPKALFIMMLLIVYIGNTHHAERTVRRTDKLKMELENLRADYTTLKADLMFYSKASEVAKKVEPIGLEESLIPPAKIIVKESEY